MPEIYLRQPGFTYSAYEVFTKNKERLQIFKETGDLWYIYQNESGKTCFQHDMAYKFFKDLTGRLASDKILRDKSFNIAENLKYDEYQHGIASVASKCFDKEIFWWSN